MCMCVCLCVIVCVQIFLQTIVHMCGYYCRAGKKLLPRGYQVLFSGIHLVVRRLYCTDLAIICIDEEGMGLRTINYTLAQKVILSIIIGVVHQYIAHWFYYIKKFSNFSIKEIIYRRDNLFIIIRLYIKWLSIVIYCMFENLDSNLTIFFCVDSLVI